MAQDLAPKRFSIASDSASKAKAVLDGLNQLAENARLLAQAGGNFADTDFDGSPPSQPKTTLIYLNSFQANVFHQQVIPAINTFLDSHLNNDAGQPTHREYLEIMVSGV